MTATFVSQIVAGAVVSFADTGATAVREDARLVGVVEGQALTHRPVELGAVVAYDFAIDGPADVPCVVVRVGSQRHYVTASRLRHVGAVQVCQEGRVFCGCCI